MTKLRVFRTTMRVLKNFFASFKNICDVRKSILGRQHAARIDKSFLEEEGIWRNGCRISGIDKILLLCL